MTGACTASSESPGYIAAVSRFIDCRAEMLDTGAFGALAAPGSTLSLLLTGFLTVFVAIIGYNLLLGRGFGIRTGIIAMIKIGAILTLVTSWPAYQALVYDVAIEGPGELAAEIGRPGGLPGSDGTLLQRLDAADLGLQQLAILGPGNMEFVQAQSLPPPPMAGFDAFALGGSRILFLISALVGVVGVRIVIALLLALGPFFIVLLLFENTRGMFEGWVRALAGTSLAVIGISVSLGFELAMLEPWLGDVLARRTAGEAVPTVATELFVTTAFFAIVMIAAMIASTKVAAAFRLARPKGVEAPSLGVPAEVGRERSIRAHRSEPSIEQPSRAALTASVIASMQRRETAGRSMPADIRMASKSYDRIGGESMAQQRDKGQTLGRAFPRRTRLRTTASAGRRDRIA